MTSTILSTLRELDCNDEEKLRLFFDDILSKTPTDDYQCLTNIVNVLIETNLMCSYSKYIYRSISKIRGRF